MGLIAEYAFLNHLMYCISAFLFLRSIPGRATQNGVFSTPFFLWIKTVLNASQIKIPIAVLFCLQTTFRIENHYLGRFPRSDRIPIGNARSIGISRKNKIRKKCLCQRRNQVIFRLKVVHVIHRQISQHILDFGRMRCTPIQWIDVLGLPLISRSRMSEIIAINGFSNR